MARNKYLTLVELLRNEKLSAGKILDLQNRKLRKLIHHAYARVPYYRDSFDLAGIRPDDIQSVADLSSLPIVTKQDILDADSSDVRDPSVPASRLVEKCTSGSSGNPFRFFVDQDYDRFCKAQFIRPYFSCGRALFDSVMRLSPIPSPRMKWFQRLGLMPEYRVTSSISGEDILAEYIRIKPDVIIGYPSAISILAEAMNGHAQEQHRPKLVFTDSEVLTDFVHAQIRSAFGVPIIDVYGSFETDNIAWQCSDGSAYHYAADCVILETVVGGRSTAPDQPGELVCTVLNSLTMPFIRYSIGDIATLSSEHCSCGRTLPLISAIEGRTMDRLTLPDGSRVSAMSITNGFKVLHELLQSYRVTQETVHKFTVAVAQRRELTDHDLELIKNAIRATHPDAGITIQKFDPTGRHASDKHRHFVSRVQ